MDMTDFRVVSAPPVVFYVPNFITPSEEEQILKKVYGVPKPKWTCLSNRRLQDYGGVPHEKGMIPEPMPQWLQVYIDKIDHLNVFEGHKPNQVLVNEYLPGQGIMPHTDGPIFHPVISTISCGSHTVLEFLVNDEKRNKVCEILLERYSLVIIKDEMYTKYLHSIREIEEDIVGDWANSKNLTRSYSMSEPLKRGTRVSLTIRYVPKVLKLRLFKQKV